MGNVKKTIEDVIIKKLENVELTAEDIFNFSEKLLNNLKKETPAI